VLARAVRLKKVLRPVVRPILRAPSEVGFHRLRSVRIYHDYLSPDLVGHFSDLMQQKGPFFVGRLGGSDYSLLPAFFANSAAYAAPGKFAAAANILMERNGYFDVDHSYDNFVKFLELYIQSYRRTDAFTYGNESLLGHMRRNRFKRPDAALLNDVCAGKTLISYQFVEAVSTFLESFSRWASGKTILIVSPFSRSVQKQFERRDDLIKGYRFPDFRLETFNTKVTYSTFTDTQESLGVETRNWHEECRLLAQKVAAVDFDIALLSCASYSVYLGDFIKNTLGKQALYLGGVLNVIFNIYGERYDTPYYNGLVNLECQIDPIENADVQGLAAGRTAPNESLNAYFGTRSD
jgi:hypothetical protein